MPTFSASSVTDIFLFANMTSMLIMIAILFYILSSSPPYEGGVADTMPFIVADGVVL